MGDFVNGEVLADVPLGGLPHEGAFRWVEFGEEGAVALRRPEGGSVWDRFMETPCGRVDLWGGGGQPKGGHALTVFN